MNFILNALSCEPLLQFHDFFVLSIFLPFEAQSTRGT